MNFGAKPAYVAVAVFCSLPWCRPATALLLGLVTTALWNNPWPQATRRLSHTLLQLSIVGLGFGLPVDQIWQLSCHTFIPTLTTIVATVLLGVILGIALKVPRETSLLIACGTAICGGSAIATMTPVVRARDDQAAVALATVFSLNAVALLLFPAVGHWLHLDSHQFGLWAGMAIHDTSSVVGAAAAFSNEALDTATTVKLSRALWIAPLAFAGSVIGGEKRRLPIPLFIVAFLLAAASHSLWPQGDPLWRLLAASARHTLVLSLFFIGGSLSPQLLRQLGPRALFQGSLLWLAISAVTVVAVRSGWIV